MASQAASGADKLDKNLRPPPIETREIEEVFKDVVVVQRKAKTKKGSFLFNTFGSFDFSDGPTTLYGMNINLGYALSDSFEAYVNYVPSFIAQERDVVKRFDDLILEGGYKAKLNYSKPLSQYGVELLWAPAYGKDSWGPYSIVRSDTFVKMGFAMIQYEGGFSGDRYGLSIGKTFFLSNWFNLRAAAGGSVLQSIIDGEKVSYTVGILEVGLIWYF